MKIGASYWMFEGGLEAVRQILPFKPGRPEKTAQAMKKIFK